VSDDGCGCIVALAVVGVVGYGAWAYLQPHPPDTSMVDARSAVPQVRPIEEAPPAGPSATAAARKVSRTRLSMVTTRIGLGGGLSVGMAPVGGRSGAASTTTA
jgi:hypothetical protein